jgi:ferrous iron transport protein B
MVKRFDGQAGAFAYLLFILLYFPCIATMGAIVRESGGLWAGFVAFWSTSMAYITATLFYQFARLSEHPQTALITIVAIIGYAILITLGLRNYSSGKKQQTMGAAA